MPPAVSPEKLRWMSDGDFGERICETLIAGSEDALGKPSRGSRGSVFPDGAEASAPV